MSVNDESNCEHYDSCLGFEDDRTVTALGIGVLLVVIFLFIASLWHRNSNLEHLLFITSRYYLYFYFVCIINFIIILVSVSFFNYTNYYSQISVGGTLILTSASTMLINIIGCKYYRSYLIMKKLSLRMLLFFGLSTLIISTIIASALLYLTIFDGREQIKIGFDWFLLYVLITTIIHTTVASLASKLAQVEWLFLICFTILYVESYISTVYSPFNLFLIYWHPILLPCISVASVFTLSPFTQLRWIGLGIFSCFVSVFDLVTDINIIIVWLSQKHYVWASLQILFIVSGVIFSGYYVKDYYGFVKITDEENADKNSDHDTVILSQSSMDYTIMEYIPSKKLQIIGQFWTFIGLGRLWHGFLGWDSERNKDMMVSNKILFLWEMIFRCMPALILQFYILLLEAEEKEYDISILLTIAASGLSVSFTILRILYGDHHSMTREEDMNLLKLKTIDRDNDDDPAMENMFKHPNVLSLLMSGYTPNNIDNAFVQIKQIEEYKYVTLDHPQFQEIIMQQLDKQEQPEYGQHGIHIEPASPAMQAPKPMPMVNNNQQQQQISMTFTINGQQQQMQSAQQYAPTQPMQWQMQPQQPQQIPLQIPRQMPLQTAQSNVQRQRPKMEKLPQESIEENAGEQDFDTMSDVDSLALTMSSEVSYKQKKNRINWTHPYIIHLKDLGWSKRQIQSAYFVFKNSNDIDSERSKIKMDNVKFLAFMINILVSDLKQTPENEQRDFSTTSECIDKMYQNFVCCLCCRILTKINEDNACCCCCCTMFNVVNNNKNANNFTVRDNIFYLGMYLFLITDFYCRIFPLLAYTVLLHKYLESLTSFALLNVFIGVCPMAIAIGLFELITYYIMLKKANTSLKAAIKYFWTGYFTISYYLLSTMHLTYLASNVNFTKLYRSHLVRMLIQVLMLCIVIGMQYILFDHPFGFFERSVFLFVFNWVLNIWIFIWMKCYMLTFQSKIVDKTDD